MPLPDVHAAGAVVTRKGGDVLLVHRPKYDDWSFPKGKLDPGEHALTAAVREVQEETGLDIRLGPALPGQRYGVGNGRMKSVHYWIGRVRADDDVSGYEANAEVDQVAWVPWDEAHTMLSYRRDRDTLAHAHSVRRKTRPVVVLRHAEAVKRKAWKGKEPRRPLTDVGLAQAERLVPILSAFGVDELHSSTSTRCVQTLEPCARGISRAVVTHKALTEEHADPRGIADLVSLLRGAGAAAVVCSHRPVLPGVLRELRVPELKLEPADLLVVHHRKGRVVAAEGYRP